MSITDPRSSYNDLIERRNEKRIDAAAFRELEDNEAFNAGWAVSAVVLNDNGQILLAYHGDDRSWLTPGGSVQSGESLREAVVREVQEETGILVVPRRPYAVSENIVRHSDNVRSFQFVMYYAHASSTEIGDTLGNPEEPIEDAKWFNNLPKEVFERELVEQVLKRIREE